MCLHWSFINWSGMIILQAVLRVTQTPSWYLPDTFQTPSNLVMLALWRASVGKAVVDYNDTKYFFVNCYFINTVLTISRTNQTPSIYPPNTHQALSNHLRAWDINWGPQKTSEPIWLTSKCLIGCWILRWSDCGWCLTDPGYCQDCIDGITVWKKEIISLYSTTALPSRGWAVGNPFQCPSHGRR